VLQLVLADGRVNEIRIRPEHAASRCD
jgi:hypothetical protein